MSNAPSLDTVIDWKIEMEASEDPCITAVPHHLVSRGVIAADKADIVSSDIWSDCDGRVENGRSKVSIQGHILLENSTKWAAVRLTASRDHQQHHSTRRGRRGILGEWVSRSAVPN
jgi:hypothetical protein